ncbi:MAG: hypothetical protein ACFBWO_00040 [Paracoccaceae bacterium]
MIGVLSIIRHSPEMILGEGDGALIDVYNGASTGDPITDALAAVVSRPPAAMSFKYVPGLVPEEPPYRFWRTLSIATGTYPVYDYIRRPNAPRSEAERDRRLAAFVALHRDALPIPVRPGIAVIGVSSDDGIARFDLRFDVAREEVAAQSFQSLRRELVVRFCLTDALDTLFVLRSVAHLTLFDRDGHKLYRFDIDPDTHC